MGAQRRLITRYRKPSSLRRFLSLLPQAPGKHCVPQKWTLLLAAAAVYSAIWVPLSVSFTSRHTHWDLLLFDLVIDCLRLLHSLFGWFSRPCLGTIMMQLLIVFPYDVLWFISSSMTWTKYLNLFKLLALNKVREAVHAAPTGLRLKHYMQLIHLFVFLLLGLHLVTCCWHWLVCLERLWEPPALLTLSYYELPPVQQYTFAFYSTVGLLVGVEIMPQTVSECIFSAAVLLLGAVGAAGVFGEVSVLIRSLKREETQFNAVLYQTQCTLNSLRVPQTLQARVYEYIFSTQTVSKRQREYVGLLQVISPSLCTEVRYVLFRNVTCFTNLVKTHPKPVQELIEATRPAFYQPGDWVIEQGEASTFLGFLLLGNALVYVSSVTGEQTWCRLLEGGDFFGEIGVFFNRCRSASVVTTKYSTIGQVDKTVALEITRNYPEVFGEFKQRLSQYRDPTTKLLERWLRQVFYARNLNATQYDHLLFSIVEEPACQGKVLLQPGEVCRKLYFLLHGQVAVHFPIARKPVVLAGTDLYNASVPSIVQTDLPVAIVGIPAILGMRQAVLEVPAPVKLVCESDCIIFSLDVQCIHAAAEFEGNLKANLLMYTSRFATRRDRVAWCPVLDVHMSFNTVRERMRFVFKKMVLAVIMHRRAERLDHRTFRLLISTLTALPKAQLQVFYRQFCSSSMKTEDLEVIGAAGRELPRPARPVGAVARSLLIDTWKVQQKLDEIKRGIDTQYNWNDQIESHTILIQFMFEKLQEFTCSHTEAPKNA